MGAKSRFEKWLEKYEKNEVIRSLIQLVPQGVGSAIDTAITTRLNKLNEKRKRIFFDELAAGEIQLTEEIIDSDDFLHAFFTTIKAVFATNREQKIRYFALLLKNATLGDCIDSIDQYEEYVQILDEMSYRELSILFILEKYCSKKTEQGSSDAWKRVFDETERIYNIPREEIIAILTRLERTGCYEKGYVQMSRDFVPGRLTPIYYRLRKLIIGD